MMHRWRQLGILCLLAGVVCPASARDAGTEGPFVAPTGARQLALGGTALTYGGGAEALAHNPALLAWQPRGSISLFHSDLYTSETSLQAGFAAYPTLDFGTFAIGVQRLAVGGIDARDARNVPLGEIDAGELHALLGHGRSLRPWLAVGATLRIVQQSSGATSATGAGVDAGVLARRIVARGHAVHSGLVLRNLVPPNLRLDEEEVDDPRRYGLGAAYTWDPPTGRLHAMLATEWSRSTTADSRWGLGLEVGFDRVLFLRAGIDDGHPTAGVGLALRGLDFAFATRTDEDLPRDDRFTVGLHFGDSVDERLARRRDEQEDLVARRLDTMLREREDQTLRRARDEAAAAWDARAYEQIEVLYRRVLLMAPDDSLASRRIDEARLHLALADARAELESGALARAVTAYQRVLDRWPTTAEARDGLRTARERLSSDRDRRGQTRALFADALARFADDDLLGAAVALDALAELDPEHEGARELAARVESARAERVRAAVDRAEALAARSQWDAAIDALRRARDLDPADAEAYTIRIAAWGERANERAAETVRASRPVSPAPVPTSAPSTAELARLQTWFTQGLRHFEAGDYERATRTWRDVWDVDPSYGDVGTHLVKSYLLLGIRAYTDGDYVAAIEQCRRALEIEPDNDKAHRYLARIEEERVTVEEIDDRRTGR